MVDDPDVEQIRDTTQFLVDDALLAATRGLTRRFHPAVKRQPNPVVAQTEPWEGTYLAPITVVRDDQAGQWRMWYNSLGKVRQGGQTGHRDLIHCAVSGDGIQWEKRRLGLIEVDGSRDNNIAGFDDGRPAGGGCRVFFEPDDPDASKRYKLIYYPNYNYYLAYSADGHTWRPAQTGPVWANGAGDGLEETNFFLHDHLVGKYRGYMRVWRRHQTIRTLSLGESDDLLTWSGPRIIWRAPAEFGPGAQIYGMNVFIDGGVYWGLIWMFYTDQPLDPDLQQSMRL
ncbi:hypothetical protein HQ590_14540, partial [bacterium]|nr:hypothetical protein [bacterium]